MSENAASQSKAWWDEVAYSSEDVQPLWSMTVEAPEKFEHQCGFVRLRERHRVKAIGVRRPA